MKFVAISLIGLFVSSQVSAVGSPEVPEVSPINVDVVGKQLQSTKVNVNTGASSRSAAASKAASVANATQENTQNQSSTQDQANSQNLNIQDKRQAPSMFAGYSDTTAFCIRSGGATLSIPGGGIGFNFPFRDKDCRLATAADAEYAKGNYAASIALRCRISYYAETLGETCFTSLDNPAPVLPPVEPLQLNLTVEDKTQCDEKVEKAFKQCVAK